MSLRRSFIFGKKYSSFELLLLYYFPVFFFHIFLLNCSHRVTLIMDLFSSLPKKIIASASKYLRNV